MNVVTVVLPGRVTIDARLAAYQEGGAHEQE